MKTRFFLSVCFLGIATSTGINADSGRSEYPLLKDTELYTKTARDCRMIDVQTWKHPVKKIFESRAVEIESVELCNDGKYPVFHAKLKYDPETAPNQKYYTGFYWDILHSNGKWPFAIVDTRDEEVIYVSLEGKETLSISNELYRTE